MNYFLDMCVMIFYSTKERCYDKIVFLVKSNKEKLITCYFIADENIPGWIKRQRLIVDIVKRKAIDISYNSSNDEKNLFEKDKVNLRKFLTIFSNSSDKKEFLKKIEKSFILIEKGVLYFIKNYISKMVIPIKEIDNDLKGSIFNWTENMSDAKTIASAVQEHNLGEELVLITEDRNDWTKENLENSILLHPSLRSKYKKIPEINYLSNL